MSALIGRVPVVAHQGHERGVGTVRTWHGGRRRGRGIWIAGAAPVRSPLAHHHNRHEPDHAQQDVAERQRDEQAS
jgi:hypothetical protein